MKKRIVMLVSIVMISAMLCSCAKVQPAKPPAAETPTAQPSEEASADVSQQGELSDSALSIVGRWSNEEAGVVTEFKKDGTYETEQNGEIVLSDTYTAEVVGRDTLMIKTGQGESFEVVFVDEYTFQAEGATMIRVTQNESIPEYEDSDYAPESLIIGIWVSDEGYMEFDAFGELTVVEYNNEDISSYPYTVETIDDRSIEITITDFDGSTSSETAYFEDSATMIMGDTTFTREID